MSLQQCKREHTFREYLQWIAWLNMQWNIPDRTDHYLMQIAQAVRQHRNKKAITLIAQKIPFKFVRPSAVPNGVADRQQNADEVTKRSRARWFAATGYNKVK